MKAVDNLRNFGIHEQEASAHQFATLVHDILTTYPVYNAHVKSRSDKEQYPRLAANKFPQTCYDMQALTRIPLLLNYALLLGHTADEYLEGKSAIYSMNAFWSNPIGSTHRGTQAWHRDHDATNMLAYFMYLTDVPDPHAGPLQVVPRSHIDKSLVPDTAIRTIIGKAGHSFFLDPTTLHRGMKPTERSRLMLWIRWTTDEPPIPGMVKDNTDPIHALQVPWLNLRDEYIRQQTRLIIT